MDIDGLLGSGQVLGSRSIAAEPRATQLR